MKGYFLLSLLIFTVMASANAQKLSSGGKPKSFESKGGIKAYEIKFPNGIYVRKLEPQNDDEKGGSFSIGKNRDESGTIPASLGVQASLENFFAFYGDLDKNNSAELIVVDFDSQSNGLGVSYYTINIFPDFQTKGFQRPLTFKTTEFGANGTFVYDAKTKETLILLTEWSDLNNLSDPKRGAGLYFVGRFFRYQNGLLKPVTDKPIYARRYLNSFQDERFRTEKNPLRPWIWLNSAKAQKLEADPEFRIKPSLIQTGTIEKFESINENSKNDAGETEVVEIKQIKVRLNSGETKTVVLYKNPDYIELESEKDKILPEIFGMMPKSISFPRDLNPALIFGNLEGKKVVINGYESDEAGKTTYKVLFYD